MIYVWSIMAAILAVLAEYLYRTIPGPWINHLWLWTPIQLAIGFCICQLVRTPGVPLVGALIIWSLCIIGLRIFVSAVLLHDTISIGTWVALCFMVAARFAQTIWR